MTTLSMTINGQGVLSPETVPVDNPATGEVFGHAPKCTPEQLDSAVEAAAAAFPGWAADQSRRRDVLMELAGAMKANLHELAGLITSEQGKPLDAARIEVLGCARWLRYYSSLELPREVIQDDERAFVEVVRRPLGPTAAISVWNFPLTSAIWKIGPGLLAGTTFVVKPSPYTPLATLRLAEIWREILPPGVVNVVTGTDELGTWLTQHAGIRKIAFTGSTATGKKVALAAATDLKRVTLELGGNDAGIVLDDADPAKIADGLFWGAFNNTGQICTAIKRLYVPESLFSETVDALAALAEKVVVGDGTDEATELGPLTNAMQHAKVAGLVAGALERGGRAVAGGASMDRPGYFYRPTIVTGVDEDTPLVAEEQFGPALPVMAYRSVDEAVARANASPYGLGASVWSSDTERAREVLSHLSTGMAWVNSHVAVAPHQPFGGIKYSGIGVENGPWGVESFTDLQMVHEARE